MESFAVLHNTSHRSYYYGNFIALKLIDIRFNLLDQPFKQLNIQTYILGLYLSHVGSSWSEGCPPCELLSFTQISELVLKQRVIDDCPS